MDARAPIFSKAGQRWVTLAVALGLGAIGGTFVYSQKVIRPSAPVATPAVKTPALKAVTALGRLEPIGEAIRISPSPNMGGAKVARLLVKEGDRVGKGQAIAVLDNLGQKQTAVALAEEDVRVARADLDIIEAGAKQGEIEAQKATIERLKAELQGTIVTGQAKIDRVQARRRGEKSSRRAKIDRLQAELGNAEREYRRYSQLAREGALAESDLDRRRLTRDSAREQLAEARADYTTTVETLTEEIAEAMANYRQDIATAKQKIVEGMANLDRITEVRGVDVRKARAGVDRAIAALAKAKADLDLAYVRAPRDGRILKIYTREGEKVADSDGLAELGDTDRMIAVAEVYESDIDQVRIGQSARVRSENNTFPGELTGSVSEIGLKVGKKDVLNSDPAADVDVRVIEVKILLDEASSRRVSNLTYAKVIARILL